MTTETAYHTDLYAEAGPVIETLRGILRELSMRYEIETQPDRIEQEPPNILSPHSVYQMLGPEMSKLAQEQFRVLLVNTRNRVVGQRIIYQGTVNSAGVRVAEVLRPAVVMGVPGIVVSHNHPSGDPTPSPDDVNITRQIKDAAKLLGVELMDHVVIGSNGYISMKEKGMGF